VDIGVWSRGLATVAGRESQYWRWCVRLGHVGSGLCVVRLLCCTIERVTQHSEGTPLLSVMTAIVCFFMGMIPVSAFRYVLCVSLNFIILCLNMLFPFVSNGSKFDATNNQVK